MRIQKITEALAREVAVEVLSRNVPLYAENAGHQDSWLKAEHDKRSAARTAAPPERRPS